MWCVYVWLRYAAVLHQVCLRLSASVLPMTSLSSHSVMQSGTEARSVSNWLCAYVCAYMCVRVCACVCVCVCTYLAYSPVSG